MSKSLFNYFKIVKKNVKFLNFHIYLTLLKYNHIIQAGGIMEEISKIFTFGSTLYENATCDEECDYCACEDDDSCNDTCDYCGSRDDEPSDDCGSEEYS